MFDPDALPVPDLGLVCKGCGYPLAGLSEHRCPECGRSFTLEEYLPRGDWPALIADGESVRATREVVKLLWTYQIPFLEMHDPWRALSFLNVMRDNSEPARIGVPRERYFEAIDLLRRQKLNEPMPDPPDAPTETEDWTCAQCGETNPGNFELCWQCGEARRDISDEPDEG